jgi:tRNA G26 N,N-dimethylase Trm1
MRDLKLKAIFEVDPIVKRKAVDALAGYGKKSIPYLNEVANSIGISDTLKAHVLSKMKDANIG